MANKKKSPHTKRKTDLGKKLFAVRKDMSNELLLKWRVWAQSKKPEITEATFTQMSRGDYISRDNKLFAIELLKEGKRIVTEFEARFTAEVASI